MFVNLVELYYIPHTQFQIVARKLAKFYLSQGSRPKLSLKIKI